QLPHQQVLEQMKQARAFVQHSVRASDGDCEGTPVAILEAGAAGLPIVATRHAGIPEAVIDGKSGHLVEERDTDAMATAMLSLAENGDLAAELGQQGFQHIRKNYSMGKSIAKLGDLLSSAVT
ncbi:MAG: glycosyltransferase, partial [Pirellulales bacterium]|nr:glycosyltransferase [Pirellulales bacterium]